MKTRMRAIAAGVVMLALFAAGPLALGDTFTITAQVVGGSRTLTVKSLSGGTLTDLKVGTTGVAAFAADVLDVQYDRVDYQVTANLSDLYAYDPVADSFDCASKIDSADISLDFLASPVSVTDIAALPAPTWDVSGTIPDPLASTLGLLEPTVITASDIAGEQIDRTLAGAFTGVENALPIQVSTGSPGPFTNPAPHASCNGTAGSPTTRSVLDGTVNSLSDLFDWVTSEVLAAADDNADATITPNELIDTGEVSDSVMASEVRDALIAAGVDPATLDTLLANETITMDDIYAVLTATLDTIADLVGQTGTYVSLPQLVANVSDTVPSGTYRGTLTITLVDL